MKQSAGILLYRHNPQLEVFLVHPGGPFWARKDYASWSIPKGEFNDEEEPLAAAIREFGEETGFEATAPFTALTPVKVSGKRLIVFACKGNVDPSKLVSNSFTMEWPPRSGRTASFPEADRGAWFGVDEALLRITKGQQPFIKEIASRFP